MADVREEILARLTTIIGSIPSLRSVQRNDVDIGEDRFPAAVLIDGDEETSDAQDMSAHPSNKPIAVRMTPEIVIMKQSDKVGTDVTALRWELIRLVLRDAELNQQIVKTGRFGNGAIRYLGCRTNVGWLRESYAALDVQFMFKYFLKPDDL